MEGNKDEALRCVRIAEEAIASGNKDRALKFIKIAQRLNHDLPVDALLNMCERLDSQSSASSSAAAGGGVGGAKTSNGPTRSEEGLNGERSYTEENVQLIREIKGKSDYYAILGLEKSCSVEEIRKAYRKLSLKVHPDKNKAPGSEEAFKKVSKAFKCLSDDGSRRQYDQTGLVDEFEYNQQYNVRRRRRRTTTTARDFFDDEFDPDEIFRAFFGQSEVFGRTNVYRARGMGSSHQRQEFHGGGGGGHNIMLLVQLLPFLIIILLAYLPFSEPDYSLQKNYTYQIPKTTEDYGVQFFVKSHAFDANYPQGSSARAAVEDNVIKDYKNMLRRYCQVEIQRRSWNRNLPTPHCEKLQNFGVA
ncbi:chaperone protein dnaJ 49 [Gastrolobium bilobum]|uniref:chaperone protein dnaJ 49 n=1 Tax=Gastrolobium bilobum TaxID=150636 RepID=UPI002AAF22BE|nr:chaperone protein dnaJ 49 [Gastrolobium bilobum]XP_061370555.1 chaperone protein dnaJ 49 [Gastrolobium bilobum]XP_061370556.1 chaperone protein dnaJ 49 [Gastrolobium bilobum]XP_061370557.1 chaperone protein dnaJ 49 [Gastrolobium bilobum]XP_061370558.1 chaperone protein dnaJ 49 [Gastrolobium bilobum]